MAAKPELLGLYWTTSGPVVVHFGREWSLFSWADRCAEARKVGFAGLGIWHADLEHVLETETLADMKKAMDDNGLTRLELEFLMDWFFDPDDERRQASDKTRDLLFDAAAALDAHHIKVGNIPGHPAALSQLCERFGELCDAAAERTDAKVVYEFMPFDTNVRSLDAVLEVVGGAARPNGGIAIDTWHMSSITANSRVKGSSTCRATSRSAKITATKGRGVSRRSPRSCATTRSMSSSGGPTRRPPLNYLRRSGELPEQLTGSRQSLKRPLSRPGTRAAVQEQLPGSL